MPKTLVCYVFLLLLGSTATPSLANSNGEVTAYDPGEVAKTVSAAYVYLTIDGLPVEGRLGDGRIAGLLAAIQTPASYQAIVYLHGCDGLYPEQNARFWRQVAQHPSIVIMPDSFARSARKARCGRQGTWTYAARLAEIEYALAKLRSFAWVDPKKIFLYGHSEGGVAVSRYAGNDIAGAIIASANCRRFAVTVASLAIRSRQDRGVARAGCSSADEQLALRGDAHDVLSQDKARQRILQFITEHSH